MASTTLLSDVRKETRLNRRVFFLLAALFSALLQAQIAGADHKLEHLFHDSQALCDSYIAFEHKVFTQADEVSLPLATHRVEYPSAVLERVFASTYFFYAIRAPPQFS